MVERLRNGPLRVEDVDTTELLLGMVLVFLSFLMPLLFNIQSFPVPRYVSEALAHREQTALMTAALLLVGLNALRCLPHYIGAFFLSESISITWCGKRAEGFNAVITILLLRMVYGMIELLHGVHYDFGIPAVLCACAGIFFQNLHYEYISRTKKAMVIAIFLTAFQFFDVMPVMDALPVGRGELSQDIKLTARVLGNEGLLNIVGMVGIVLFFLFGVLIFFQLRAENALRALNVLEEQNASIRTEVQINEMKNRTYQEMQYLVHDLKSPLTALQTLVGVLKMESEAEHREHDTAYLTRIEENVEQMSRMISEILYEDQCSPITTEKLVRIALAQVSTSDYAAYIRVRNDAPKKVVRVNHVLFPRALVNLLQNAAQAVSDRARPRIQLRVEAADGSVRFTVADNGVGISPERRESVWQHGVSSTASSGLGLAFVRSVVERLGGTAEIEGHSKVGTEITLTIPEEETE